MIRFKKVISILVLILFSARASFAVDLSLRPQSQFNRDDISRRFNHLALAEQYGLTGFYDRTMARELLEARYQRGENILILYIDGETVETFITPQILDYFDNDGQEDEMVLGHKNGDLVLVYTDPLRVHEESGELKEIIIKGVTLAHASASFATPIKVSRRDVDEVLEKLSKVIEGKNSITVDDEDVHGVLTLLLSAEPNDIKARKILEKLKTGNNREKAHALVAIIEQGGWFSAEGALPEIDFSVEELRAAVEQTPTRRHILGAALGVFGLAAKKTTALGQAVSVAEKILPAELTLEEKIAVAKNGISDFGKALDEAKFKGGLDLSNLSSKDKLLTERVKAIFKDLEEIKTLFSDKDALEGLISFSIEEKAFNSLLGILFKLDTREVRKTLSRISRGRSSINKSAGELLSNLEYLVDGKIALKKRAEIFLGKSFFMIRNFSVIVANIMNWIVRISNISPFGLPKTFEVRDPGVYNDPKIGDDMKMILQDGGSVYDLSTASIVSSITGNIALAKNYFRHLWQGALGATTSLHGSYDGTNSQPFIYDLSNPLAVRNVPGQRGFRFKIFNVKGNFLVRLPDGKVLTWDQWQPIAGENAWIVLGALQTYYSEHGEEYMGSQKHKWNEVEIKLAEELARAAMLLQVKDGKAGGAIRMAPKGTWSPQEEGQDPFEYERLYNEISTENNLSWLAAFRMLYDVTGKLEYKEAAEGIEKYMEWIFDPETKTFFQGAHFDGAGWVENTTFASDVQLWGISVLGADWIEKFGNNTTYEMLQYTLDKSGVFSGNKLIGLDYTDYRALEREPDRSSEWTKFGVMAFRDAAKFYGDMPARRDELNVLAGQMNEGIDELKLENGEETGYFYSKLGLSPVGHGWITPPNGTLHLAATAWAALEELDFNPFKLPRPDEVTSIDELEPEKLKEGLHQNYPNPFSDRTTIRYVLNKPASNIEIRVYDILGREIKNIIPATGKNRGVHKVQWDGTNDFFQRVSGGVYIIRLVVDGKSYVKKVLFLPTASVETLGVMRLIMEADKGAPHSEIQMFGSHLYQEITRKDLDDLRNASYGKLGLRNAVSALGEDIDNYRAIFMARDIIDNLAGFLYAHNKFGKSSIKILAANEEESRAIEILKSVGGFIPKTAEIVGKEEAFSSLEGKKAILFGFGKSFFEDTPENIQKVQFNDLSSSNVLNWDRVFAVLLIRLGINLPYINLEEGALLSLRAGDDLIGIDVGTSIDTETLGSYKNLKVLLSNL